MKIYELCLIQKKGYKTEPEERTLHISKEVAEQFANKKISQGFDDIIGYYGSECIEHHFDYYPNYHLHELEVNEGE